MALTASQHDQRRLLELADVDSRILREQKRIANPPQAARVAELDDALVRLDHAVLEKLGAVDDLEAQIGRLEADVRTVQARHERDQARLLSGVDAKTATAIEHELATLARRRETLEDQELALMEQLEAAQSELTAARAAAAASRGERDGHVGERDADAERARSVIADLERERGSIAAGIAADLVTLYERQRERYGVGASLLQRRTSTASGVELTAAELHEVQSAPADAVLLCPYSSAILVRTDESGL